jgi:hypothetical protein
MRVRMKVRMKGLEVCSPFTATIVSYGCGRSRDPLHPDIHYKWNMREPALPGDSPKTVQL